MGKVIAIASGKGGVGKTTLTASLGVALAQEGAKVLVADGDFGMRDLDLAFGVENEILFDAVDLWKNKCFQEDALISLKDNLDFLPASQSKRWEDVGRKGYMKLLKKFAKDYDFVIVDSPAGLGRGVESILNQVDQLLVIVEPFWSSLRDAEGLMLYCNKQHFFNYALVINRMPYDRKNSELSVDDIVSTSLAEILGAILPDSLELRKAVQEGKILELDSNSSFFDLLQPLVDCVYATEWLEEDVIKLFKNSRPVSINKDILVDRTEKLVQILEPKLSEVSSGSLRNRTRSIQWRNYRRR